jgi:hypothetical protein
MPQVPYQGFPEPSRPEEVQQIGTPNIRISTPAEAFGVGIAHAVEGLGKDATQVGNELFSRALALQQLQNETDSIKAKSTNIQRMSEEQNKFLTQEGLNAGPQALSQHLANLDKIRTDIRKTLPNVMVQKEFDAESTGFMGYLARSAGAHSAQQFKQHAKDVYGAQLDAAGKAASIDPTDPDAVERQRESVRSAVHGIAVLDGKEDIEEDMFQKAFGVVRGKNLAALALRSPIAAVRELAKPGTREEIGGDQYDRLVGIVRNHADTVIAQNISDSINSDLRSGRTETDETIENRQRGAQQALDAMWKANNWEGVLDYDHLKDTVQNRVESDYKRFKQNLRSDEQVHMNTIAGLIQSGIPNMQALLASEEGRDAFNALPKTKQLTIPGMIDRYQSAVNKQTNQDNFLRLRGMAYDDPQQFLGVDITKEHLSQGDMRKLFDLQHEKRQNSEKDPQVQRALNILDRNGILKRAEISKTKDADRYHEFVGALQDAMVEYQSTHGKPPPLEEVMKMGKTLTRITSRGFISDQYYFEQLRDIPQKDIDDIREKLMQADPGTFPTDEDIIRETARLRYRQAIDSGRPKPTP